MHTRILFQVTKRDKNKVFVNLINFREVMINKNLVDFELYAALHVAFTLWLLEVFAAIGYDILRPLRFEDSESKKAMTVLLSSKIR